MPKVLKTLLKQNDLLVKMANVFNNDRFPAFNFRFLDHFSLQVKCFDRTLFYFGD